MRTLLIIGALALVCSAAFAADESTVVPTYTMATTTDVDSDAFNRGFITTTYGISASTVDNLRAQGFSWSDINMMANAAVRTGQPIDQIATLRSQQMSWSDIACKFNVPYSDIANPSAIRFVRTNVAPTEMMTGAGPISAQYMYDYDGNVILNWDQAQRLYRSGYDWLDIAVAGNIVRETGYPIDLILTNVRSGMLWSQILRMYGVTPEVAYNVTCFPFPRTGLCNKCEKAGVIAKIEKYQCPIECPGAGPCGVPVVGPCPVCPKPCPTPCATPCPAPCPTPCPTPCPSGTTCPTGTCQPATWAPGAVK